MIPVNITCEAERGTGTAGEWVPLVRVNGETVWRGRPVAAAAEAEGVALGYVRYALGGALINAPEPPAGQPGGDAGAARPLGQSLEEVVEGLRREVADGVQRVTDFIERGEWRRFLP